MAMTSGRFIATAGLHVMRQFFWRFIADKSAVTVVEYALIAGLISTAIAALGQQISGTFNTAKTTMKTA